MTVDTTATLKLTWLYLTLYFFPRWTYVTLSSAEADVLARFAVGGYSWLIRALLAGRQDDGRVVLRWSTCAEAIQANARPEPLPQL
jgi:hypothetical protein